MKNPYSRPWLALAFYVLAALIFLLYLLMGLGGFIPLEEVPFGVKASEFAGFRAALGAVIIGIGVVVALLAVAVGYVIEKIAKIEWNTLPDESAGLSYTPPGASAPVPAKRYFYIANGPLNGPFSAPEILDLYRSGKVPNNARLYVEEAGNRRLLANWSEIGV